MKSKRIDLEIPIELWDQLAAVARELGLAGAEQAALTAIADWVSRQKAELDNRDPSQRYFVNEALDELAMRKKE